ncbi:MAG: DUF4332 domain-containing protein [Hyphomicrobiaceae bacterium]
MHLLFRIVYAAHANGTHHKLALDALRFLRAADGEQWQRLFLKNARLYLDGSKAPDTEFKDFKNHVLHVRDGLWGGAPEKVRSWYGHLVEALRLGNWENAVYCAGVLSHYLTDPIHPFHTAQSEAENNVHRAVEWSISKSYDALWALDTAEKLAEAPILTEGPNWLVELVCRSAELSNRHYESLIVHYDFHRGVVDPPAGLDANARRIVAGLIGYAARAMALVLDKAIAESGAKAPEVTLTVESLLATLQIPLKWLTRKLADAEDRKLVERMYDELQATGRVEENLPEDDRTVRDLHRAQVLAKQARTDVTERFPLPKPRKKLPQTPLARREPAAAVPPVVAEPSPRPVIASVPSPLPSPPRAEAAATPAARPADTAPIKAAEPAPPPSREGARFALASLAPREPTGDVDESRDAAAREGRRFRLAKDSPVVDAPAIGPKTADRLMAVGIDTVADLLAADPSATAEAVAVRHIKPATIADWQDQARLVLTVPGLSGTNAQLLVGAGYRSAEAVAKAEQGALLAALLRFVRTPDGERVLRSGSPPDIEKALDLIARAKQADLARAA